MSSSSSSSISFPSISPTVLNTLLSHLSLLESSFLSLASSLPADIICSEAFSSYSSHFYGMKGYVEQMGKKADSSLQRCHSNPLALVSSSSLPPTPHIVHTALSFLSPKKKSASISHHYNPIENSYKNHIEIASSLPFSSSPSSSAALDRIVDNTVEKSNTNDCINIIYDNKDNQNDNIVLSLSPSTPLIPTNEHENNHDDNNNNPIEITEKVKLKLLNDIPSSSSSFITTSSLPINLITTTKTENIDNPHDDHVYDPIEDDDNDNHYDDFSSFDFASPQHHFSTQSNSLLSPFSLLSSSLSPSPIYSSSSSKFKSHSDKKNRKGRPMNWRNRISISDDEDNIDDNPREDESKEKTLTENQRERVEKNKKNHHPIHHDNAHNDSYHEIDHDENENNEDHEKDISNQLSSLLLSESSVSSAQTINHSKLSDKNEDNPRANENMLTTSQIIQSAASSSSSSSFASPSPLFPFPFSIPSNLSLPPLSLSSYFYRCLLDFNDSPLLLKLLEQPSGKGKKKELWKKFLLEIEKEEEEKEKVKGKENEWGNGNNTHEYINGKHIRNDYSMGTNDHPQEDDNSHASLPPSPSHSNSGRGLEFYSSLLFKSLGYLIHQCGGGSHDEGLDILIEKGGTLHGVQCKQYGGCKVTYGEMVMLYGVVMSKRVRRGENGKGIENWKENDIVSSPPLHLHSAYFITTSDFSRPALNFVSSSAPFTLQLINREKLITMMGECAQTMMKWRERVYGEYEGMRGKVKEWRERKKREEREERERRERMEEGRKGMEERKLKLQSMQNANGFENGNVPGVKREGGIPFTHYADRNKIKNNHQIHKIHNQNRNTAHKNPLNNAPHSHPSTPNASPLKTIQSHLRDYMNVNLNLNGNMTASSRNEIGDRTQKTDSK